MMNDSLRDQAHDLRLELCMNEPTGATVDAPCDDCDGEGCGECRQSGFRKADIVACTLCGGSGDGRYDWRGNGHCEWCKGTGKELRYRPNILWEIMVDCRHCGQERIVCYDWDLDHELSRVDRSSVELTKLQG